MSQELIAAIADRVARGYTKDVIAVEVMAAGYTEDQFNVAYAATTATPGSGHDLIPYSDLLRATWRLMVTEFSVFLKTLLLGVAAFVAAATAIFLVSILFGVSSHGSFLLTVGLVPLGGLVIGFVTSFTLMRAIVVRRESILFREHVRFVVTHVVPIAMVTVYLTIITQVGYSLFFIPGIMATVYLLFSSLIVVGGEATGFSALVRSTQIVYGRFWPTFGRFLLLNFVMLAAVVGLFVALGGSIALILSGNQILGFATFPFIFVGILALCVGGFFWTTCGLVVLFESLKAVPSPHPLTTPAATLETFYKVIVGVVVVILAIVAFIAGFAGYAFINWN